MTFGCLVCLQYIMLTRLKNAKVKKTLKLSCDNIQNKLILSKRKIKAVDVNSFYVPIFFEI